MFPKNLSINFTQRWTIFWPQNYKAPIKKGWVGHSTLGLLVITAHIVNTYTLCPLIMPHRNPLKVVTPTFQMMKLGELVRGFKSQLECLDLPCLWSTLLEGPQRTWTNQTLTWDFLPSKASVSLSIFYFPVHMPPLFPSLSLLLPVFLDSSVSGQMFSGELLLPRQDMTPLPTL